MISRNDKGNNELLRKMDNLLYLLTEHTNSHKDCCLKNILRLIGTGQPLDRETQYHRTQLEEDPYDR
jgi:hypothetical protein